MKNLKALFSKKVLVSTWLVGLVILSLCAILFKEHSLQVYPGTYQEFVRSDSQDKGFSEVSVSKTDSLLVLDFRLRSGSPTPYAGVGFSLVSPMEILKEEFLDFSAYDSLRVVLATNRMPKITIRLSVHDPLWTKPGDVSSARPLDVVLETTRNLKEHRVSLADFSVPEKWFDLMGIENPDYWRHLERGMRVEVLTATGALLGIPDAFELKKLELYGTNRKLLYVLGVLAFLLSCACGYGLVRLKQKG